MAKVAINRQKSEYIQPSSMSQVSNCLFISAFSRCILTKHVVDFRHTHTAMFTISFTTSMSRVFDITPTLLTPNPAPFTGQPAVSSSTFGRNL